VAIFTFVTIWLYNS